MSYRLRDDVGACIANGQSLLFDVAADRYVGLAGASGAAFRRFIEAAEPEQGDTEILRGLVARGYLVETSLECRPPRAAAVGVTSAVDEWRGAGSLVELAKVVTAQLSMRRRLKRRGLHQSIQRLREAKLRCLCATAPLADDRRVSDLIDGFLLSGRIVGNRDLCLLRSLTLATLLARRGVDADLVFAVRGQPFAAHCWTQLGTRVLNDTLEHTQAFTPILIL